MKKLFLGTAALALVAGMCVTTSPQAARADDQDRTVNICNYRGSGWSDRIVHVYATSVGRNDWGEDKLDGHILVGECRKISTGASGGYCEFDYKLVDASGRAVVLTLNSCKTAELHVTRM